MSRTIWDYFREVEASLAEAHANHATLEARVERLFRKGKVTDVDAQNQLYRQEIGLDDDGQPVKSPWVPYAQFAGARKIHTPPTVGQQYMLISPDGDHEQGHGVPLTFSDSNPSPSQSADQHVDQLGDVTTTLTTSSHERDVKNFKITHNENGFTLDMDGTTFAFSKSGLAANGGKLTHNGLDIGASHKHGGVEPGGGDTDVPLA